MLRQSWDQSCDLTPTDSGKKDMPISVKQTTGKTVNRSSSILQVKVQSVAHGKQGGQPSLTLLLVQRKFVEKIRRRILYSITAFRYWSCVGDTVENVVVPKIIT